MTVELRTRMILDLAGDFGQKIQGFARDHDRFASGARYSLGVAGRAWDVFGNKVDTIGNNFWARVAGAGGLALAVKQTASYDESITRIGINANASAARMGKLKAQIFDVAQRPDINMKVEDLAAGVGAIVEKTGDLDFASKNMLNIARFAQATGDSAEDVGALVGEMKTFGVEAPDDILKVVDSWSEMGKTSGLALRTMLMQGPQVISMYEQLGRTGPTALKEVGAVLAMTTKQQGNARKAIGDVMELLEYMNNRTSRPLMMSLGITDISGKMQVSMDEAMKRIIRYTNGNQAMLQTVAGESGSRVFAPLISQFQSGKPMDALQKYMDVQADGSQVIKDAARDADEAAESFNKLYDSWQQFDESNLGKDIKLVGHELSSISPDTLQKVFKGLEYAGGGLLAIYGARKLWGAGGSLFRGAKYIFGGGKGGVGGMMEMAGATPVFVVNMPGGGFPGGGGGIPGSGGAGGNILRPGLARSALALARTPLGEIGGMGAGAIAGSAGLLAAAGLAGAGAGTLIYHATDDTAFMDHVGSAVAHFMSLFDDSTRQAIDQRNAGDKVADQGRDANINLKLSFDAQGNPVLKNVKSDTHKLNLDFDYTGRGGYLGAMP